MQWNELFDKENEPTLEQIAAVLWMVSRGRVGILRV